METKKINCDILELLKILNTLRGKILISSTAINQEEMIIGRNAIREALLAGREIDSILLAKGTRDGALNSILKKAKERRIPVKETENKKLDLLCGNARHQGILAMVAAHEYSTIEDIFNVAKQRNEPPFIVIADGITDPHNLGAIIRTAECAGAHGVIIPARRAVGLNFTVAKAAAGALEHVKVARVTNLSATLDELKKRGVWVYGADMDGKNYCEEDLTGAVALVVGSEGFGISRLVKEKCDAILSIPLCGKINSLNASVAAGVIMCEVSRQRLGLVAK